MPATRRQAAVDSDLVDKNLSTPQKTRVAHTDNTDDGSDHVSLSQSRSAKPRRGRPPGSGTRSRDARNGFGSPHVTPSKAKGKSLVSTFLKNEDPLSTVHDVDRSARRKSARRLVDQTTADGPSDEDDLEEENLLAEKIWDGDEVDSDEVGDDLTANHTVLGPSSTRRPSRRKKSPTPPQNLPSHENYFWQNRPGKIKTSNNTLSSISLLTHEQYHHEMSTYIDPHRESYDFLHSLHSRSFPQWRFELSQTFNICLYGYGSKRKLVTHFAKYLHARSVSPPRILIVNGYTPTLTLRQLFTTLATLIYDSPEADLPKLGSQPREILTKLLGHLSSSPPTQPYRIFINSLDAPPLRRAPAPALLAQLAAHPSIELLATCDNPNFPLLWDLNLRNQYNFLFHDTTTMESYADAEIFSVIDDVNELLGRSGRSVKGKEGVGFVLKSLPENARSLYRILVSEILAGLDSEGTGVGNGLEGTDLGGIEYKILYQKVVEEFVCSNEMGFRQLLKEFYDHQMLISRRDGVGGAEVLGVPWRKEECEAILEDLIG